MVTENHAWMWGTPHNHDCHRKLHVRFVFVYGPKKAALRTSTDAQPLDICHFRVLWSCMGFGPFPPLWGCYDFHWLVTVSRTNSLKKGRCFWEKRINTTNTKNPEMDSENNTADSRPKARVAQCTILAVAKSEIFIKMAWHETPCYLTAPCIFIGFHSQSSWWITLPLPSVVEFSHSHPV